MIKRLPAVFVLACIVVLCCAQQSKDQSFPYQPPSEAEPRRQFDFWIGDWDVVNHFFDPARGSMDIPGAQLHIRPILNGSAIIEHYRGTGPAGNDILGFSVRAWNPDDDAWTILLNWPSGNARFWTMQGSFRHNRGVFNGETNAPDGSTVLQRYTFSDLIDGYYRWDGSQSRDNGATWTAPTFVMEGTRRADDAPAHDLDRMHGHDDIEHRCPGDHRRVLDALDGTWTSGAWQARSQSILAGCAHMILIERTDGAPSDDALFIVAAYDDDLESWVVWFVSPDGRMTRGEATQEGNALVGGGSNAEHAFELGWNGDGNEWTLKIAGKRSAVFTRD